MDNSFRFPKKWIVQCHSLAKIKKWTNDLAYFRYFRAFGGHMNDGDTFKVRLVFKNLNELLMIMDLLGFCLEEAIIGNDLTPKYRRIEAYPKYLKPEHQTLIGGDWFLWVEKKFLTISIAGTGLKHNYDVTDKDFEKCIAFEKLIQVLGLRENVDTSFFHEAGCISIENYPDLLKK